VNADSGSVAAVSLGDADLDGSRLGWVGEELVEVRCARVTHDCVWAAGEGRGQFVGSAYEHLVADRVDAAVHAVKGARPKASLDRPASKAKPK
jgi:hypothetical protein